MKNLKIMYSLKELTKPSKEEQQTAMESYKPLTAVLETLKIDLPEIEIEETGEKIKIPLLALKLLAKILKATSKGQPVAIVPQAAELTSAATAELLNCSRPHVNKLIDMGEITATKVGKHRRIKFEDVMKYKKQAKEKQKALLIQMMNQDQEDGLYDT